MALAAGTRLGPYEILEPLGAGGMGEIYRARDPRLEREVAIKVLPEETARDTDRLRRLEREARAASALNHPNIVTIYDIGEEDGTLYVVMECVEGRTLRDILGEGALRAGRMLPLATQIGEGLAKAHSAGIVHRDLKPENVMVTSDGLVKILDFGLAKLQPQAPEAGSDVVTATKATRDGAIVGTVQYMSPEQAAGRPVDYRSDQFSFGSILYEMATGRVAFERESVPQTQVAIIEDEVEPMDPGNVPPHFPAIVERCLAKSPEGRYDSTRDLARELKSLLEAPSDRRAEGVAVARQRRTGWGRMGRLLAAAGVLAAALAVAVGLNLGGLRDRLLIEPGTGPIRSLAVLPLQNLSGDPEQEYFSDGMTEALIADLAKIKALRVISRQSVMRYKGSDEPLPEIARELGVDAVLAGSVVRAGDRVRVTAQLIEAATDRHLWADSFDRELRDILSLYSDVAQAIAGEIQANLTPEEEAGLARARPVSSDSYDAYLMGRYLCAKRDPESLGKAIEYFQKAIQIQPDNALGYAGLAEAYTWKGVWGYASPRVVMPRAREAVLKALEIDEALPESHVVLGRIKWDFEWDWDGAERELQRAIDLGPSNAAARGMYSMYLLSVRRMEDALSEAERALELDPLSLSTNDVLMWNLYFSRRFDEVPGQCRRLLELDPASFAAHWGLALAYHHKGMYPESWAMLAKGFAGIGFLDVAEALERGHRAAGYSGAMREGAIALTERRQVHHVSPVSIAVLFAFGEERERALEWLERAFEERDPILVFVRVAPYWDSLRSDSRFQDVVRRMDFPE